MAMNDATASVLACCYGDVPARTKILVARDPDGVDHEIVTWVFDEEAQEECVIVRCGAYFFWALGPAGVDVFLDGPVTCIACIARVAEMGRL